MKDDLLVIEGFITTDPGPHEILITRLGKFAGASDGGVIISEPNVVMYLLDQNGVRTDLVQSDTTVKEILKAVFAITSFSTENSIS